MPTADRYVQVLGLALDDFGIYFASGGSTTTAVIPSLINSDTNASPNGYDDAWLYNSTKSVQARVKHGGFNPANGTLTFVSPVTATAGNDRIFITHLFPYSESIGPQDSSSLTIVNRAASMLISPGTISLTIVPGQTAYSLSAQAFWLDRNERVGWPDLPDGTPQPWLLEPGPTGGLGIPADWRRPRLRLDTGSPYLEIEAPFAVGTTGSMTLRVQRPGNTLVNGAESTNGLVASSDIALPSQNDVLECSKLEAYSLLAQRGMTSATGSYADKVGPQLERCRAIRYFDETQWKATPSAQASVARAA